MLLKTIRPISILLGLALIYGAPSFGQLGVAPHAPPRFSPQGEEIAKQLRQLPKDDIHLLHRVIVERHRAFRVVPVPKAPPALLPVDFRQANPALLEELTAQEWDQLPNDQYHRMTRGKTLLFRHNFLDRPLLQTQVVEYRVLDGSVGGSRLVRTEIDDFECRVEGPVLISSAGSFSFVIVKPVQEGGKNLEEIYGTTLLCGVAVPLSPQLWYRKNENAEWLFRFQNDPYAADSGQVEIQVQDSFGAEPRTNTSKFTATTHPTKTSWRVIKFENGHANPEHKIQDLLLAPSKRYALPEPNYRQDQGYRATQHSPRTIALFNHDIDDQVLYTPTFWSHSQYWSGGGGFGGGFGGFGF